MIDQQQLEIRDATRAQAENAIRWLKAEVSEEGGFYHNRGIIREAARDSEMKCLCLGRRVLGFAVCTHSNPRAKIDIFEIRPRYRGQGLGRLFASRVFDILFTNAARSIQVECAPRSSQPFWIKLGFSPEPGQPATGSNPRLTLRRH